MSNKAYKCRKCRIVLFENSCVRNSHSQTLDTMETMEKMEITNGTAPSTPVESASSVEGTSALGDTFTCPTERNAPEAANDNVLMTCKDDKTIIYIDDEKMPNWMNEQVDTGDWLKGRLVCPNPRCSARIGSFDFISGAYCSCHDHELPAVRMIRSKIDEPTTFIQNTVQSC